MGIEIHKKPQEGNRKVFHERKYGGLYDECIGFKVTFFHANSKSFLTKETIYDYYWDISEEPGDALLDPRLSVSL